MAYKLQIGAAHLGGLVEYTDGNIIAGDGDPADGAVQGEAITVTTRVDCGEHLQITNRNVALANGALKVRASTIDKVKIEKAGGGPGAGAGYFQLKGANNSQFIGEGMRNNNGGQIELKANADGAMKFRLGQDIYTDGTTACGDILALNVVVNGTLTVNGDTALIAADAIIKDPVLHLAKGATNAAQSQNSGICFGVSGSAGEGGQLLYVLADSRPCIAAQSGQSSTYQSAQGIGIEANAFNGEWKGHSFTATAVSEVDMSYSNAIDGSQSDDNQNLAVGMNRIGDINSGNNGNFDVNLPSSTAGQSYRVKLGDCDDGNKRCSVEIPNGHYLDGEQNGIAVLTSDKAAAEFVYLGQIDSEHHWIIL